MERCVEPELLDRLPPLDQGALGSRRDLRRLNELMGHARLAAAVLGGWQPQRRRRLADLGGGDGTFLLRVARLLGQAWKGTTATVVDRQAVVSSVTEREFADLGWHLEIAEAEVEDWLAKGQPASAQVLLANLFLHHFREVELERLLAAAARRAAVMIALEPRRSALALRCSRLVGLIGCNPVTQHDAVASVRAGFTGQELSRLWPRGPWSLEENAAGWFSHCFVSRRTDYG